jgi:3-hydroxyisobutyrate dehydrogenase
MVGASDAVFEHVRPILETMGSDVTHCGPVGCGQVVKILNNMLVFQHCAALAEAIALGRRNGVPADILLPTMAKGSGDSFVLRTHGLQSMLPGTFPKRAFSTRYAIKDLGYALEMAEEAGIDMAAAKLAMARLHEAVRQGYAEDYHPVVLKVIDPQ